MWCDAKAGEGGKAAECGKAHKRDEAKIAAKYRKTNDNSEIKV